jgi:hypothetical protein
VLLALEVFNDDETAQKPDLPARPEPRRTFAVSRGCPLYDISRSDFVTESWVRPSFAGIEPRDSSRFWSPKFQ